MRRLIFVACMVAGVVQAAPAEASFLSWLEELSGPGPFTGPVFSVPVACVHDSSRDGPRCNPDGPPLSGTIHVRFGNFYSRASDRRFKDLNDDLDDNHGVVRVRPFSVVYLLRLHRALEVGGGGGVMFLSGDRFSPFTRLVLTPFTASLTPLTIRRAWPRGKWRQAARALRIDVDAMLVPQGFRGSDFNNSRTRFDSGPDLLWHAGVVLDFSAFGRSGPLIR